MKHNLRSIRINWKSYLLQNRNIKQILLKNTIWLMFGEGLAKFILFLNTVVITRYLGVEKYGILSFSFAFCAVFSIIIDFGFNNYVSREISKDKLSARKHIDNILTIKGLLSVLTFLIIFIFIKLLKYNNTITIMVFATSIYTVLQSYITFFQTIFQSYERMQHTFVSRIFYTLLLFITVVFIVFAKLDIQAIIIGYIFASVFTLIFVTIQLKKYFTNYFIALDVAHWKNIITESWPFFAGIVCVAVYVNLDTTLISYFRNFNEVGLYQAADKILTAFLTITMFHQVLFPRLSNLYGNNKITMYLSIMRNTFKISLIILIPVSIAISILSKDILIIVYGKDFASANIALIALIWTGVLIYFSTFWGNTLMIINQQKKWFYAVLTGAIVNIILNLIFIPIYGYVAAAIITSISECSILIISYFLCPINLRNFLFYKKTS